MSLFDNFTNQYNVTKTLVFELKPIGKTEELINSNGYLEKDEDRLYSTSIIQSILTRAHRKLINDVLGNVSFNNSFEELANLIRLCKQKDHTDQDYKNMYDMANEFRNDITSALKKHKQFGLLTGATPEKYFKELDLTTLSDNEQKAVALFKTFWSYFTDFQNNRKFMYDSASKEGTIAYRCIDDNFAKFVKIVDMYNDVKTSAPQIIEQTETELKDILNGQKLDDIFNINSYGKYLIQSGITFVNNCIGGYTVSDKVKKKGLNELINLYNQHDKPSYVLKCLPKLNKQILSEEETISFKYEDFQKSQDVMNALYNLNNDFDTTQLMKRIQSVVKNIDIDNSGIFINRNYIHTISQKIFKEHDTLTNLMQLMMEDKLAETIPNEKKRKQEVSKFMNQKYFSLAELKDLKLTANVPSVDFYWKSTLTKNTMYDNVSKNYSKLYNIAHDMTEINFFKDDDLVEAITNYINSVFSIYELLRPLVADDTVEKDYGFYYDFEQVYEEIRAVIPVLNKCRNFITKVPSNKEKMRVMFDKPTFGSSWSESKQAESSMLLLRRNDNYFIAVLKNTKALKDIEDDDKNYFEVLELKYTKNPNITFPKNFLKAKCNVDKYGITTDLIEGLDAGKHKVNSPSFDKEFMYKLIEHYKKCLKIEGKFDYSFSDTKSYTCMEDFYDEVIPQSMEMVFAKKSYYDFNYYVDQGDIFLFQIWSKDCNTKSYGLSDLNTLYFQQLFSQSNLENPLIQICAGATMYYRKQLINKPYTHKKGEYVVNRRDTLNRSIPECVHKELVDFYNGKLKNLSEEAKVWKETCVAFKTKFDIVKDRRYASPQFSLHLPIKLNWLAPDNTPKALNDAVNELVSKNRNQIKVIGINRGLRNLAYLTMIDSNGKIIMQRSLNEVGSETPTNRVITNDYHEKILSRNKERISSQQKWRAQEQIANLKDGYISAIIPIICKLAVENNAIIALENLSFGNNGVTGIDLNKQVFQRFEKALITKLNYYTDKRKKENEIGFIDKGYQLTNKCSSFQDLDRQSGIVHFVQPGYITNIDITTGFVNIFNFKDNYKLNEYVSFFEKFDYIKYDAKTDSFMFSFDYSKFNTIIEPTQKEWIVYSANSRFKFDKIHHAYVEHNPTKMIKDVLIKAGVNIEDGYDMKPFLMETQNEQLFFILMKAFKLTLQMHNMNEKEDYIVSPVLNSEGKFFDTRKAEKEMPECADALAAYNIALKCLLAYDNAKNGKIASINTQDWLSLMQQQQ